MRKFISAISTFIETLIMCISMIPLGVFSGILFYKVIGSSGFAAVGLFVGGIFCAILCIGLCFLIGCSINSTIYPDPIDFKSVIERMKEKGTTFEFINGLLYISNGNITKVYTPELEACRNFITNSYDENISECLHCSYAKRCRDLNNKQNE